MENLIKRVKRGMPELNTSSFDLIFTMLFFFMICLNTTMREVTLKVQFQVHSRNRVESWKKNNLDFLLFIYDKYCRIPKENEC